MSKFSSSGSLLYSTYIVGGGGSDVGHGIAVDSSGCIYVTGYTPSTNFPTRNPYQSALGNSVGVNDVFVTQARPQPIRRRLSHLLHLPRRRGGDVGYGIAVDSSGNAYVTGHNRIDRLPHRTAYQANSASNQDAFVTKLVRRRFPRLLHLPRGRRR